MLANAVGIELLGLGILFGCVVPALLLPGLSLVESLVSWPVLGLSVRRTFLVWLTANVVSLFCGLGLVWMFGGPVVTYYSETRSFVLSGSLASLLGRGAVYWAVTVVAEYIVWSVARPEPQVPSGRRRLASVLLANMVTYAPLVFLVPMGLD